MKSNFEDVVDLHAKFQIPVSDTPTLMDQDTQGFRVLCLYEELGEFTQAIQEENLPDAADALIDLVVFAMGTAHMMGLPWEKLWAEVHRANMSKERVDNPGESKRGSGIDLKKPDGWQPPNITGVLANHAD